MSGGGGSCALRKTNRRCAQTSVTATPLISAEPDNGSAGWPKGDTMATISSRGERSKPAAIAHRRRPGAPAFATLRKADLSPVIAGLITLAWCQHLSSIDTPTCAKSVRQFNERAAAPPNTQAVRFGRPAIRAEPSSAARRASTRWKPRRCTVRRSSVSTMACTWPRVARRASLGARDRRRRRSGQGHVHRTGARDRPGARLRRRIAAL